MTIRILLWLWCLAQCYGCAALVSYYKAWYSDIPEEIVLAVRLFPWSGGPLLLVVCYLSFLHLGAHIVLVSLRKIPVHLFVLLVVLPWAAAFMLYELRFIFF